MGVSGNGVPQFLATVVGPYPGVHLGTKTLKAKHLLRRDPHSWPGFRANMGTRCHWERNLHPPPEPDKPGTARSQAKPLVLTKNSVDQPTFH